jgi:hypothetical protein
VLLDLASLVYATGNSRSITGTGGVVVGGAATIAEHQLQHVSVVGTGGVRAGGAAAVGERYVQHVGVIGAGGVRVSGAAAVVGHQIQHVSIIGAGGVVVGGAAVIGRHQLGHQYRKGARSRYRGRRIVQRVHAPVELASAAAVDIAARVRARRDAVARADSALVVASTARRPPRLVIRIVPPTPVVVAPVVAAPVILQRVRAAVAFSIAGGLEIASSARRRPVHVDPAASCELVTRCRSVRRPLVVLHAPSPQLTHPWRQRTRPTTPPMTSVTHMTSRMAASHVPSLNAAAAASTARLARTARAQALAVALIDDDDM